MNATASKKVLIVDDDPVALALMRGILEGIGHRICGTASSGATVVEDIGATNAEVVVMDVAMPGVDGLEATRRVQESCPLPVVLLTAHDDLGLVGRAGEAGAGAYVVKPPRRGEMARAIAIAVARHDDWMRLRRANEELAQALARVRKLQGLLPICACCKKIRDDDGYWHGLEQYIQEHSDAEFTHGLCEDCGRSLYPEDCGDLPAAKVREVGGSGI